MGGIDIVIICAGTGYMNPYLWWEDEEKTINVNVKGFTCIADTAFQYFMERKEGCLAAISSVAALRGSADCPLITLPKPMFQTTLKACAAKQLRLAGIYPS